MRVVAADVGGTSTRMAVVETSGERLEVLAESAVPSRRLSGLEEALATFLATAPGPCRAVGIGVAGPVRERSVDATNLPWGVDAGVVAATTGVAEVVLLNDLEAAAWGLAELGPESFETLQEGRPEDGNRALISPGTGLGMAGLAWDGTGHRPFASEGGHADFAPRGEREIELLHHLEERHGDVSWERVVSGPGLAEVFRFLRPDHLGGSRGGFDEADDPAAWVTEAARSAAEDDHPARRALDLFLRAWGSVAGDLALQLGARGGVFLGGGIAPRLVDELRRPVFLDAFRAKGPMRPYLEAIGVHVVLETRAPLLGAARCALDRLGAP